MNEEQKQRLRAAAKANGMRRQSDWDDLERYLAESDEDAARGLIWSIAEEPDND